MSNSTSRNYAVHGRVFAVALILVLSFSTLAATLQAASAHTPAWTIPTFAYIVASPDRIGVNQPIALIFWLNWVPPGAGGIGGDRWRNLSVEVTKPNGQKQTLGPFTSDPIGGGYSAYVPDQIGTYTVTFSFPGQVPSLIGPTGIPSVNPALWDYINDTFQPSTASTTFTVQQEPLQPLPGFPLPTTYWTRPIEGQNTNWAVIASNWLGNDPAVTYNTQPNGIAPNSAHVMWTRPLQDGGVVGGTYSGGIYYAGDSYEMRFNNPMIINGRLYYDLPLAAAKTGGGYIAVDLRTGEEIWWANWTSMLPAYGQIYDYESINQHGVLPSGILWRTTGSTMMAYDSLTATWLFNLTNVPSGNNYYDETGAITRYVLGSNRKWLALWNNTFAHDLTNARNPNDFTSTDYLQWRPNGKNINASSAYSWNISLPASIASNAAITYVSQDDLILLNTPTTFAGGNTAFSTIPYTMYAISLKQATRGTLLWSKQYDPLPGNVSRQLGPVDPLNRIFTTIDKETMQWSGFDLDSGAPVWGPLGTNLRGYQYYDSRSGGAGSSQSIYQGKLYIGGFNGIVQCRDTKTGNLLWTYGTGGPGNSTFSGLENVWGYTPTFLGGFADGKVFTMTQEHSVNTPIYKGALIRALNASTGQEIWTLPGFASSTSFYSRLGAIADGYLAYFNAYDGQVYSIGKGPSAVTVTAPDTAIPSGTEVLMQGTVTDISAGAKAKVQSGEFTIVPAMSDASQSKWMQYIYMQKPKPNDVTGVKVHLTAIDPNNNFQDIGTTTSDASGSYAITWTPPVPGLYTVTASFEGSESYFPSSSVTHFNVVSAPAAEPTQTPPVQTPPPTTGPTQTPASPTPVSPSPTSLPPPEGGIPVSTYVAVAAAVIIIAVVVAAIALRRRK